jgi:hypothetical protein
VANSSLRVLLVLSDPDSLPGWIARLIERLEESAEIEICAVAASVESRRRTKDRWLFRLLYRLELAAGMAIPGARHGLSNHILRISLTDKDAVHALAPDVILDLSGNQGNGISAAPAQHGVWFTDATCSVPGISGLRPLLEGRPVSTITLFRRSQALAMPDAIASAAVNIKFIAARNENFLEEKSVTLIMRELKRLALGMPPEKPTGTNLFVAPSAPGPFETLAYLGGMTCEFARRAVQAGAARLGFRPGMFGLSLSAGDPLKFKPSLATSISPPAHCFHADPFFWKQGEENWCFFESFDYRTGLGTICAGQLEADRLVNIRTVLAPGYHLSFPFLFEHDGQLFMMPESCATRRIELWRCTAFPDTWELHKTVLEGTNPADSTLAEIDGQWWLFTNICDDPYGDMSSELHLYRADGPMLNNLEPHPLNPVVFDSRCARNAGRIWQRDGIFYRPAQDNSHGTYGYGLQLMRIEELSMEHYRESSVRHIIPTFKRGIIGCHHIDLLDGRIVFDVRYRYGGRGL